MSLSTSANKYQYTAGGGTVFAFPVLFLLNTDLRVTVTNLTTGVDTVAVLNTDYTVTGAGVAGGGSVTFGVAPTTGRRITIERIVPLTQLTDYVLNDNFPSDVTERNLDKATMALQQLKETTDRSLHFPSSEVPAFATEIPLAAQRLGKLLGFDGTGALTVVADVSSSTAAAAASAAAAAASAVAAAASAASATGSVTSVDASGGVETVAGSAITVTGTVRGAAPVNSQTGTSYVILTGDRGKLVTISNAASVAVTLPQAGGTFPANWYCRVQNRGAGTVTITPTTSTVDGAASIALTQNQGVELFSDGANYFTFRGSSESATASDVTGVMKDYLGTAAPTGYVLASGRTLGNSGSGGTERANADTLDLYTLLWDSFADAELAVSSGRGASAAADFAALKTIALPDMRGRVAAGKDNMGGSTASRLTAAAAGFDGTVMGKAGGVQTHSLTVAELAAHHHACATISQFAGPTDGFMYDNLTATADQITKDTGSGDAHQNTQPTFICTKIIKL